ncbi:SDR family oxidoreductase [Ferruginibacter sp. HRS2-29]|uniref:SDR family oxidoreductase n=1 Tax=Ferruginibacter sp. HRS2-29 TaxID=2487334 RepID=UPI0020CD23D2|nr:SDR family NAD(P)-dependent oxidoreductase [Ferruginibacter sp. HRS2-29]MCP9752403.1 SDR family NAD(P)-dependent oxidoreductase [Ferruginibacter sp. HRS2-29]
MNTINNTILITGGSAGIGFEIARLFSQKGNHVIITGRDEQRLAKAAAQLQNVTAIQSDVTDKDSVEALTTRIRKDFPALNIVINNAGKASVYNLDTEDVNAYQKAAEEFETNFLSVLRLNEALLPLLKKQPEAAIVNVSSIVAFVPGISLPTYAASKAALHSYTRSLRLTLERSTVKVFELMPPLVNTEFSTEIGGANGIPPAQVAEALWNAFEKNQYEIRAGNTEDMYRLYLSSPENALEVMNAQRREILAAR